MAVAMLVTATPATGQTVTVAKTGGGFTTVQSAIDSFASDSDPAANVIQITDSEVYDEVITINRPLTLEGTAAQRPRLALQANAAAAAGQTDGLVIALPAGTTTGTVALKDLILLPSRTVTPTGGRAVRTASPNMFVLMDNILITANNGSDQPVSVDGLTLENMAGATHFGDDGIFIGSANGMAEEAGVEALFRDLVVTHNRGGVTPDGIVCSNAGTAVFRKYRFEDGCVFTYNQRVGMQLNGDIVVDAPSRRLLVRGHASTGFWLVSAAANQRSINGLNVEENGGRGMWIQGVGTAVNFTIKNMLLVNNGTNNSAIYNFDFTTSAGTAPEALFEEVTIANQRAGAGAVLISGGAECPVRFRNSIIAGNGSLDTQNTLFYGGTAGLTLEGTAIVTAGAQALSSGELTIGGGTVNGTPTTTADPEFLEVVDGNSEDYFDVSAVAYATANATGGPLSGGADYVPDAAVSDWNIY